MARQIDEVQVETDLGLSAGGLPRTGPSITLYEAQSITASLSATLDSFKVVDGTVTWLTPTNITTATGINTVSIGQATHSASSTMSMAVAASMIVKGAPLASGSMTITTPMAVWVQGGQSRFDGQVLVAPGTATNPSIAFWGELGGAIGYDTSTGWHPDTGFFSLGDPGFGGNLIGVATAGYESTRFTPDGLMTFALQANYLFGGSPAYSSGIPSGRTDASPLTIVGGALTTSRGLTVRTSNLFNATSGTQSGAFFNYTGGGSGFAPTSGTAEFRAVEIQYEVNQTGGANGQITGLYVKGTNTATASFAGHDILWVGNETTANFRVKGVYDGSAVAVIGDNATGITAWSRLEFNTNSRTGQIYFLNVVPCFLINPSAGGSVAFGGQSFADGQGSLGEVSQTNGMRSTYGLFVETPGGGGSVTYDATKQVMKLDTTSTIVSATSATWNHVHVAPLTATISGSTAITTASGLNMMAINAAALVGSMAITASATLKISGDPTISGGGSITNPYALWLGGGHIRSDGFGSTGLIKNNNGGAWTIATAGTDYVVSLTAGANITITGTGGVLTIAASTGTSLTAGTGITFVGGTAVTSNLSTGVSGGQTAIGGTAANQSLTLQSTTNATRGPVIVDASQFLFPDGSLGAPGAAFSAETNTGIYRVGGNQMGFVSGSTEFFRMGAIFNWSAKPLTVGAPSIVTGTSPAFLGEVMCVDGSGRLDARIAMLPGAGTNITQIGDGQFSSSPPGLFVVAPNSTWFTAGPTGNTYAGTLFSQPTAVAQSGSGSAIPISPFATVVIAGPVLLSNGTGTWGTAGPTGDSFFVVSGRSVLNGPTVVGSNASGNTWTFRADPTGTPVAGFFSTSHGQFAYGAATAGGTYGATEQTMLQRAWDILRAFGFNL